MVKDAEALEFAKDLDEYICSTFGYTRGHAYVEGKNIHVDLKKVSLYVRFCPPNPVWKKRTLVIASIAFAKQRRGYGTALLRWIKSVSQKHGIQYVGVEQTHTDEVRAFCRKHSFTLIPDPNENENWYQSVTALPD
jgi:hypothetical protein